MTKIVTKKLILGAGIALLAMSSSFAATTAYNNAVDADGALFHWTFDEVGDTANAVERVGGAAGNELTAINGATRAASTATTGGVSLGRAANFVGNTGVFGATGATENPITSQRWALEFWVNINSNGGSSSQYLINSDANNPAFIYDFSGTGLVDNEFEMFSGSGRTSASTNGDVVIGTGWHHVVAAFYGNGGSLPQNLREIYVDGDLVLSDTTSGFSSGFGLGPNFFVGGSDDFGGSPGGGGTTRNGMDGMIDEVALYELDGVSQVLDQAQVADLAAHYSLVPEPSSSAALLGLGALALILRRRK